MVNGDIIDLFGDDPAIPPKPEDDERPVLSLEMITLNARGQLEVNGEPLVGDHYRNITMAGGEAYIDESTVSDSLRAINEVNRRDDGLSVPDLIMHLRSRSAEAATTIQPDEQVLDKRKVRAIPYRLSDDPESDDYFKIGYGLQMDETDLAMQYFMSEDAAFSYDLSDERQQAAAVLNEHTDQLKKAIDEMYAGFVFERRFREITRAMRRRINRAKKEYPAAPDGKALSAEAAQTALRTVYTYLKGLGLVRKVLWPSRAETPQETIVNILKFNYERIDKTTRTKLVERELVDDKKMLKYGGDFVVALNASVKATLPELIEAACREVRERLDPQRHWGIHLEAKAAEDGRLITYSSVICIDDELTESPRYYLVKAAHEELVEFSKSLGKPFSVKKKEVEEEPGYLQKVLSGKADAILDRFFLPEDEDKSPDPGGVTLEGRVSSKTSRTERLKFTYTTSDGKEDFFILVRDKSIRPLGAYRAELEKLIKGFSSRAHLPSPLFYATKGAVAIMNHAMHDWLTEDYEKRTELVAKKFEETVQHYHRLKEVSDTHKQQLLVIGEKSERLVKDSEELRTQMNENGTQLKVLLAKMDTEPEQLTEQELAQQDELEAILATMLNRRKKLRTQLREADEQLEEMEVKQRQAQTRCEKSEGQRDLLQGTLQAFNVNLIGRIDAQAKSWELKSQAARDLLQEAGGTRAEQVAELKKHNLWTPIMENYLVRQGLIQSE